MVYIRDPYLEIEPISYNFDTINSTKLELVLPHNTEIIQLIKYYSNTNSSFDNTYKTDILLEGKNKYMNGLFFGAFLAEYSLLCDPNDFELVFYYDHFAYINKGFPEWIKFKRREFNIDKLLKD
jgi:hypothetical protein